MEKINFKALDKTELVGLLYNENTKTQDVIIAVHGMTSNCFKRRDEIIAKKANENNIDYFCFNNRGSDLAKYIKKKENGKSITTLGGMSYENVKESHYDVIGAIKAMKKLGYKNIYLQGHSLGSTKVVYAYKKMREGNLEDLENIKGVILLSLVDIPSVLKFFLKDKSTDYIELAKTKIEEGKGMELMPRESFIHPICAKSFIQYAVENEEFDFINIQKDRSLVDLNNIEVPIFMRWGNVEELILQEASEHVKTIRRIIKNKKADINYIEGADHSYHGKEETLSNQIIEFIKGEKG